MRGALSPLLAAAIAVLVVACPALADATRTDKDAPREGDDSSNGAAARASSSSDAEHALLELLREEAGNAEEQLDEVPFSPSRVAKSAERHVREVHGLDALPPGAPPIPSRLPSEQEMTEFLAQLDRAAEAASGSDGDAHADAPGDAPLLPAAPDTPPTCDGAGGDPTAPATCAPSTCGGESASVDPLGGHDGSDGEGGEELRRVPSAWSGLQVEELQREELADIMREAGATQDEQQEALRLHDEAFRPLPSDGHADDDGGRAVGDDHDDSENYDQSEGRDGSGFVTFDARAMAKLRSLLGLVVSRFVREVSQREEHAASSDLMTAAERAAGNPPMYDELEKRMQPGDDRNNDGDDVASSTAVEFEEPPGSKAGEDSPVVPAAEQGAPKTLDHVRVQLVDAQGRDAVFNVPLDRLLPPQVLEAAQGVPVKELLEAARQRLHAVMQQAPNELAALLAGTEEDTDDDDKDAALLEDKGGFHPPSTFHLDGGAMLDGAPATFAGSLEALLRRAERRRVLAASREPPLSDDAGDEGSATSAATKAAAAAVAARAEEEEEEEKERVDARRAREAAEFAENQRRFAAARAEAEAAQRAAEEAAAAQARRDAEAAAAARRKRIHERVRRGARVPLGAIPNLEMTMAAFNREYPPMRDVIDRHTPPGSKFPSELVSMRVPRRASSVGIESSFSTADLVAGQVIPDLFIDGHVYQLFRDVPLQDLKRRAAWELLVSLDQRGVFEALCAHFTSLPHGTLRDYPAAGVLMPGRAESVLDWLSIVGTQVAVRVAMRNGNDGGDGDDAKHLLQTIRPSHVVVFLDEELWRKCPAVSSEAAGAVHFLSALLHLTGFAWPTSDEVAPTLGPRGCVNRTEAVWDRVKNTDEPMESPFRAIPSVFSADVAYSAPFSRFLRSEARALLHLTQAAEAHHHVDAMLALRTLHAEGMVTPRNCAEAVRLTSRAFGQLRRKEAAEFSGTPPAVSPTTLTANPRIHSLSRFQYDIRGSLARADRPGLGSIIEHKIDQGTRNSPDDMLAIAFVSLIGGSGATRQDAAVTYRFATAVLDRFGFTADAPLRLHPNEARWLSSDALRRAAAGEPLDATDDGDSDGEKSADSGDRPLGRVANLLEQRRAVLDARHAKSLRRGPRSASHLHAALLRAEADRHPRGVHIEQRPVDDATASEVIDARMASVCGWLLQGPRGTGGADADAAEKATGQVRGMRATEHRTVYHALTLLGHLYSQHVFASDQATLLRAADFDRAFDYFELAHFYVRCVRWRMAKIGVQHRAASQNLWGVQAAVALGHLTYQGKAPHSTLVGLPVQAEAEDSPEEQDRVGAEVQDELRLVRAFRFFEFGVSHKDEVAMHNMAVMLLNHAEWAVLARRLLPKQKDGGGVEDVLAGIPQVLRRAMDDSAYDAVGMERQGDGASPVKALSEAALSGDDMLLLDPRHAAASKTDHPQPLHPATRRFLMTNDREALARELLRASKLSQALHIDHLLDERARRTKRIPTADAANEGASTAANENSPSCFGQLHSLSSGLRFYLPRRAFLQSEALFTVAATTATASRDDWAAHVLSQADALETTRHGLFSVAARILDVELDLAAAVAEGPRPQQRLVPAEFTRRPGGVWGGGSPLAIAAETVEEKLAVLLEGPQLVGLLAADALAVALRTGEPQAFANLMRLLGRPSELLRESDQPSSVQPQMIFTGGKVRVWARCDDASTDWYVRIVDINCADAGACYDPAAHRLFLAASFGMWLSPDDDFLMSIDFGRRETPPLAERRPFVHFPWYTPSVARTAATEARRSAVRRTGAADDTGSDEGSSGEASQRTATHVSPIDVSAPAALMRLMLGDHHFRLYLQELYDHAQAEYQRAALEATHQRAQQVLRGRYGVITAILGLLDPRRFASFVDLLCDAGDALAASAPWLGAPRLPPAVCEQVFLVSRLRALKDAKQLELQRAARDERARGHAGSPPPAGQMLDADDDGEAAAEAAINNWSRSTMGLLRSLQHYTVCAGASTSTFPPRARGLSSSQADSGGDEFVEDFLRAVALPRYEFRYADGFGAAGEAAKEAARANAQAPAKGPSGAGDDDDDGHEAVDDDTLDIDEADDDDTPLSELIRKLLGNAAEDRSDSKDAERAATTPRVRPEEELEAGDRAAGGARHARDRVADLPVGRFASPEALREEGSAALANDIILGARDRASYVDGVNWARALRSPRLPQCYMALARIIRSLKVVPVVFNEALLERSRSMGGERAVASEESDVDEDDNGDGATTLGRAEDSAGAMELREQRKRALKARIARSEWHTSSSSGGGDAHAASSIERFTGAGDEDAEAFVANSRFYWTTVRVPSEEAANRAARFLFAEAQLLATALSAEHAATVAALADESDIDQSPAGAHVLRAAKTYGNDDAVRLTELFWAALRWIGL